MKYTCVLLIAMRRIVLDTNCLLQSLPSNSSYHKIWTDVLGGKIQLCVNTEILNEYEEILASKTTKEIARYNLSGRPCRPNDKGIQTIVFSDFTTKTIIVE